MFGRGFDSRHLHFYSFIQEKENQQSPRNSMPTGFLLIGLTSAYNLKDSQMTAKRLKQRILAIISPNKKRPCETFSLPAPSSP